MSDSLLAEMPEDHPTLVIWLQDIITDVFLGQLMAELHARYVDPEDHTIEWFLGDKLDDVLMYGLSVLSAARIQELLERPSLLLALQTRILTPVPGSVWESLLAINPALLEMDHPT